MSRAQGISGIFANEAVLVGMVHLLPLPGSPRWGGSMEEVVDRAVADATSLAGAGFDGVMVENYLDAPFHADQVSMETVAAMAVAAASVRDAHDVPLGVNVLRNDVASALSIAAAVGAAFVRVNVHTGSMWTDQGLIHGRAAETLRLREKLAPDVAILADVHVKHARPPEGSDIAEAALETWDRGLADGLIVSGPATGLAVADSELSAVLGATPEAPIFVGSGVTPKTAPTLLSRVRGVIVGSAVMQNGKAGSPVDDQRARSFVEAARGS